LFSSSLSDSALLGNGSKGRNGGIRIGFVQLFPIRNPKKEADMTVGTGGRARARNKPICLEIWKSDDWRVLDGVGRVESLSGFIENDILGSFN
jgi:hypothetical protein